MLGSVAALIAGVVITFTGWMPIDPLLSLVIGALIVFSNLRRLATESRFWLAFLGIVALAFAVNLVELLCSAGIPAVYTQVLAMSELAAWQYYAYLALYILVFMPDDLFAFVVAMKTLQLTGVTTRYTRFSHLAGGVVLFALGALLLAHPADLLLQAFDRGHVPRGDDPAVDDDGRRDHHAQGREFARVAQMLDFRFHPELRAGLTHLLLARLALGAARTRDLDFHDGPPRR